MMAETKGTTKKAAATEELASPAIDLAAAEDVGYLGTSPDPIPNEEYTLTTGPESPSAAEAHIAALRQRADDLEAEIGKGQ